MVQEVNISLWEGVAFNGPERKYFACYCKNISLWEGVLVWEAGFLLFHFWRMLGFCKAKCVKLLVYHGS